MEYHGIYMAAVRMKDIAHDLGVSVVTVSKALRNHEDISEETRARVLQRISELNYRPNLAARALVTGRSYIIGFVVPGLLHSFFAEVAQGLTAVLRKKGFSLVIASSDEDPELEAEEIEQLLARRVDALIVASTQQGSEVFRTIEEQKVPYVLIDRKIDGIDANFVGVDDEICGEIGTEHLIQCGHKRIAFIGGKSVSTAEGRRNGYSKALAKHGIAERPEYLRTLSETGDAAEDEAGMTMLDLIALDEPPTAVYCGNDPIAMGAMKAALDIGKRIPEDIAFCGTGNVRYGSYLRVPLTSVDQGSAAIGERAARLALSLIESKVPMKPKTITIEPKLVVRQSTKA